MSKLDILYSKCSKCFECIKNCPNDAIEHIDEKLIFNDNCSMCGVCLSSCKHGAMVYKEASMNTALMKDYSGVLVVAELNKDKICDITFELLSEGRKLADELDVDLSCLIIGSNIGEVKKQAIEFGADSVYVSDMECFKNFNDETYSKVICACISKYKPEIVLIGGTSHGRSIAPKVASCLKTGLTADCTKLSIDIDKRLLLQTRPAFGGNLLATIVCSEKRPQIATVRSRIFKKSNPDVERIGKIIAFEDFIIANNKLTFIDYIEDNEKNNNLTESDIVVIVGRGVDNLKNMSLIEELAHLLNASIGATRAIVDSGWMDYSRQIGQTGKVISPKVCITCGVSGAIQHLTGILSSEIIIAINNNPNAPIFNVATYGILGDLSKILPKLINNLKTQK